MFSHPLDPPSLKAARALEASYIAKWVVQRRARGPRAAAAEQAAVAAQRAQREQQGLHLERPGAADVAAAEAA